MSVNKFVGMNKLMETLRENKLLNSEDLQLNIYFDDLIESKNFKGAWSIQPLHFEIIDADKKSRVLTFKEFNDLFPILEWINIGKQLNKEMKQLKLVKKLYCIKVLTKTKNINGKYEYHPMKLNTDVNQTAYKKLLDFRSKVKIEHLEQLAEKVQIEEDEEDEEFY